MSELNRKANGKREEIVRRIPLVKNGELTKLPCCKDCHHKLKLANERNKTGEAERDDKFSLLPHFAFKVRDFGRIPSEMPKLSTIGRTAISPFVAFTKVTQLRSSSNLPASAQYSTTGSGFSVPTEEISGKEFVIPLSNNEFVQSFSRELPRDDVASRHRIYFMGNLSNWKSMEATLNKQNRGNTFDINACEKWLRVLQRTGALSSQFKIKRKRALSKLQKKILNRLQQTNKSTDSSAGVILEGSIRAKEMAEAISDDVAKARSLLDKEGSLSDVPGISSSMFCNNRNNGKFPLLKAVLNSLPGRSNTAKDSLLLKIKREFPNEFEDFPQITTHTFPDLFPIPISSDTFGSEGMMSLASRRHLLNYYDGRFCDKYFIFWMSSVLTRHSTLRNASTFFKRDTNARMKFEKLANDPELEKKLEQAINNETSKEAKELNSMFSDLMKAVGGNTPWSALERQATLGKLNAMSAFFGLPSIFLTIAPCIADSSICINLCSNINYKYSMKESTHKQRSQ